LSSVRPSVCNGCTLHVTFYTNNYLYVLNSGMQNFSHLVQAEHFQIGVE